VRQNPELIPDLREAVSGALLGRAFLIGANLSEAVLIQTDLRDASLAESRVYGASVWDIKVNDQTKQQNLIITAYADAAITIGNIKVAQFIYLLLNNQEIRDVIDTITSKAVLILGRFSKKRKAMHSGRSFESLITFRSCSTSSVQQIRRLLRQSKPWRVWPGSSARI
jgi:uncharacterized protein YjbI with pentapeptide repeats